MNSVFYINKSIIFFNENFELIQQNIDTGSEKTLMSLEGVSEVVWNIDNEYIYFITNNKLFKKPLKTESKASLYAELSEHIINMEVVNTKNHKALYLNSIVLKDNYIVRLEVKPEI